MNASPQSSDHGQDHTSDSRLRVEIHGAVQGVGFRPFVYRLANELALHGWVINDTRGVFIEVEGNADRLEAFLARLPAEAPAVARIVRLAHAWLPPAGYSGFEIRHSDGGGERSVLVLPDLATCPACRAELFDAANRRHRYPFTNCTDCGPRFTIVQALPYDRPNTTMRGFALCPACQAEYDDPRDRRFHAQPNACAVCGPQVAFYGRGEGRRARGRKEGASGEGRWPARVGDWTFAGTDEVALRAAEDALRRGEIVAAKGLGGFHLLVDARNEEAVQRLRERKARPAKPLAVMVRDLAQASTLCEVPPAAAELLTSTAAPIVLLPRRPDAPLAEGVAPGNPDLGIMLPYTPLHHLLLADLGFPLVATSGNLTDEPICTDEWEALERLGAIADCFLLHDRPIARHADDSVLWIVDGAPQFLRRARGFAPLPIGAPQPLPTILGVGAHLKNTVALSIGEQVFLSQHIGDLESAAAYEAFQRVIADFLRLYEAQPAAIAHDLHPEYLSTKWAVGERVTRWGDDKMTRWQGEGVTRWGDDKMTRWQDEQSGPDRPVTPSSPHPLIPSPPHPLTPSSPHPFILTPVQHHHAHLAACLTDNGVTERALGLIWDGTGYGTDGTIWGGECLLGDAAGFERVAHLRPFRLPGGEAAVREPRRVALALLWQRYGDEILDWEWLAPVRSFAVAERRLLGTMLTRGINAPVTTSMGRLFDGMAALIGLRQKVTFEGEAAMELEYCARRCDEAAPAYALPLTPQTVEAPYLLDWGPLLDELLDDVRAGVPAATMAARFHAALVECGVAVAAAVGEPRVALSGGCFQNRRLTEALATRLRDAGHAVLLHRQTPPNDGCISLGQVMVAAAQLGRAV